jgi:hypothetical protein
MAENVVRLKKEYKLIPASDNFKVTFGTINRINPKVIYIKINAWCKFNGDLNEYIFSMNSLAFKSKQIVKNKINNTNVFDSKFFYSTELKKILLDTSKPFHACFEITLRQNDAILNDISLLTKDIENIVNELLEFLDKNNLFEFSKNKKMVV